LDARLPRTIPARPRAALAALLVGLLALPLAGCSAAIARHAAAGHADSVEKLLAQGASPDAADWKGRRAIELAVHFQHADTVAALVKGGADLDRVGRSGMAPLHEATRRGNPEIVKILLDAGADPRVRDAHSYTALGWALRGQQWACVELLVAAGARVDGKNDEEAGLRALSAAVRRYEKQNVKLALMAGVDPDAADQRGRTARFYAEHDGHTDLVALFDAGRIAPGAAPAPAVAKAPAPARKAAPAPAPTPVAKAPAPAREAAPAPAPAPTGGSASALAASGGAAPSTPLATSLAVAAVTPTPQAVPLASPVAPIVARGGDLPEGMDLGHYYALVIGNDDYQHLPGLHTAVNDARAVAQILRDHYGHAVTLLENATRADILRALGEYRRVLGPSDNLLIYYAGHGWLDAAADRGYWLPVDANEADEVYWIDNGSVTSAVRAMQAKHVLVVADSCYSGKLTRGIHIARRSPGYMERLALRRARVVLTSGGIEPVMDSGGVGQHSVFAAAFLQVLEDNAGVLEGHELFSRLRRPVALNSDQVPEYSDIRKAGHDGGDFLFVRTR
jgi:ankyrin repeat protein